MRTRILSIASAVAVASVFSSSPALSDVHHEVIFIVGMPASGFPAGATIASLDFGYRRPIVNRRGHVVISGAAVGGGVTAANDNGVWLATRGGLVPLLREGDPVPALSPAIFVQAPWVVLGFSDDDGLLLQVGLTGDVTTTNDTALIWVRSGEPIQVVAREGGAASPLPEDGTWSQFAVNAGGFDDLGNSHGDALIQATTTTRSGFFKAGRAGVVPLLRINDPAPGLPGVSVVSPFRYQGWGDAGVGLVFASLAGDGVTPDNSNVILSISESGNAIFLREGDVVPGIDGAVFGGLTPSASSSRVVGQTLTARATIRGAPVEEDELLLIGDGSTIAVAMREGDPIPGGPVPNEFSAPYWEDAGPGTIAFSTSGYPGGLSTWLLENGELIPLTRPGDPAPEFETGVQFQGTPSIGNDGPTRPSRFGRVAILTRLQGFSWPSSHVVYQRDLAGQLRRVLQFGDIFETPLGDTRALTMLNNMSVTPGGLMAMSIMLGTASQGVMLAKVDCPDLECGRRDLDGDCVVGIQDLAELLSSFGEVGFDPLGDINLDGDVDLGDLAEILASFGTDCRN